MNYIMSYISTVRKILLKPHDFFKDTIKEKPLNATFFFILNVAIASSTVRLIPWASAGLVETYLPFVNFHIHILLLSLLFPMASFVSTPFISFRNDWNIILSTLPIIQALVSLYTSTAAVPSSISGRSKASIMNIYNSIAYASAAYILIPFIGFLGSLYWVYLLYAGLSKQLTSTRLLTAILIILGVGVFMGSISFIIISGLAGS